MLYVKCLTLSLAPVRHPVRINEIFMKVEFKTKAVYIATFLFLLPANVGLNFPPSDESTSLTKAWLWCITIKTYDIVNKNILSPKSCTMFRAQTLSEALSGDGVSLLT